MTLLDYTILYLAAIFVASLEFYLIYGKFAECKFYLIAAEFKQQFEHTPFSMIVGKSNGFFFWDMKNLIL